MDTDQLSIETYNGILGEAEKLSHDLTTHYGMLSYECADEEEYIEKAEKLTKSFKKANAIDLDDLFWGNPPKKENFINTLNAILKNIDVIKLIPIDKRTYDL
jgi:hypothetical protein